MKIDQDTVVTIQYTLAVQDGETPQDLARTFTARFLYGRDRVLPLLEKVLVGRSPSDEVAVSIPSEQAFGPYDPRLVQEVRIADLAYPQRLEVGRRYEEVNAQGKMLAFDVKELHDNHVVADFNHPAAGKALTLSATVQEVRAASLKDIMAAMNLAQRSGG